MKISYTCKDWRYRCVMLAHQPPPCLYYLSLPAIKNLNVTVLRLPKNWNKERQVEGSQAYKRQIKGKYGFCGRHNSFCNPILIKWLLPLDAAQRQENLSALPVISANYQKYSQNPCYALGAKSKYDKRSFAQIQKVANIIKMWSER